MVILLAYFEMTTTGICVTGAIKLSISLALRKLMCYHGMSSYRWQLPIWVWDSQETMHERMTVTFYMLKMQEQWQKIEVDKEKHCLSICSWTRWIQLWCFFGDHYKQLVWRWEEKRAWWVSLVELRVWYPRTASQWANGIPDLTGMKWPVCKDNKGRPAQLPFYKTATEMLPR